MSLAILLAYHSPILLHIMLLAEVMVPYYCIINHDTISAISSICSPSILVSTWLEL